jgi:uncharacterized protein
LIEKTLYVILKTVERCNLNCTYCYFFNQGEESYKKHPAFISEEVINQFVVFLRQAVSDFSFSTIQIAIHGGEPTLQPKAQFDLLCQKLRSELKVDLKLSIQTNGTLIDDRWIELFTRHQVAVGVSLDGPPEYNDLNRIDHKGLGSYVAVLKGIEKLLEAVACGKIPDIGVLCVMNPARDGAKIYRHFVDDLNLNRIDFLFPDVTHDTFDTKEAASYGEYFASIFDEWIKDNNPRIRIRFLETVLAHLVGKKGSLAFFGPDQKNAYAITISSNGEISPDDTLRTAGKGKFMQQGHIGNMSLKQFFALPILSVLDEEKSLLPKECAACCWQNICGGGSAIHRYSTERGFGNLSVMCEGLKLIYTKSSKFLIDNGYPIEQLEEKLCQRVLPLASTQEVYSQKENSALKIRYF